MDLSKWNFTLLIIYGKAPERKFRIGSTLALTALTLGHVAQGNMLMDQVK